MIMQVSQQMFADAFRRMDRADQFSPAGLNALYDHIEETDEDYELDVIALCCEFTEYESLEDACADIGSEAVEVVAQFEGGVIILNN